MVAHLLSVLLVLSLSLRVRSCSVFPRVLYSGRQLLIECVGSDVGRQRFSFKELTCQVSERVRYKKKNRRLSTGVVLAY